MLIAATLGEKVRRARQAKRMTLAELAAAAGCSAGLLSQVERGRVMPSIPTLAAVAEALGVPIGSLFPTIAESAPLFRPKENALREPIAGGSFVLETVAHIPVGFGDEILVWITDVPPGGGGGGSPIGDAQVVAYLLSGRMHFSVKGEEYDLERGDQIAYRCGLPHYWSNHSRSDAQVLWVVIPGSCYRGGGRFYASAKGAPAAGGTWRKEVGSRLRAFRRQRRATLSSLAKRVGCSVGLLSQIEHGRAAPSVKMLCRIAEAMDVPVGALFPPASTDEVALRRAEGRTGAGETFSLVPVARIDLGFEECVCVYHAVFGAEGAMVTDLLGRAGEEVIRAVRGSIRVEVGGQAYTLGAGDTLRFPAAADHRARRVGRRGAEAVWIISPPRERA